MVPVVNLRNEPALREALARSPVHGDTVLIDRRTRWGNPFRIGPGQTRARAVARYRVDLWRRIRSGEVALEDLAALAPCRLACWCWPEHDCHGVVLARAAAWAAATLAARGAPCTASLSPQPGTGRSP